MGGSGKGSLSDHSPVFLGIPDRHLHGSPQESLPSVFGGTPRAQNARPYEDP